MVDTLALSPAIAPAHERNLDAYVTDTPKGLHQLTLLIEGAHCANCITKIEGSFAGVSGVETARLNLSTGRLLIEWRGKTDQASGFAKQVENLGFGVRAFDNEATPDANDGSEKQLLRALAVAGFGAANIMLMSVAIWSGAADEVATRSLFHFLSALIAVPVVGYAGRPFFKSALMALKVGTTNMDVPISLAVLLAVGLSLVQMTQPGQHVWFESATMLLFFLLIGRLLNARARGQAHSALARLLAMRMVDAHIVNADGTLTCVQAEKVEPGMRVQVPMGTQVPVDGMIDQGRSSFDTALVTGESAPRDFGVGDKIYAGTINMGQPVILRADAVKDDTLLADITRLMESAQQRRGQTVILADRIARAYVPVVHILAALAFAFWLIPMAASLPHALEITIAVLVITCPCALALAVPVVQVLASTRLMQAGMLLKSPAALERLAQVDYVVFDKTGTLTLPSLTPDIAALSDAQKQAAAMLAAASHHPLAQSLAKALPAATASPITVEEIPGAGMRAQSDKGDMRLGRADWVGAPSTPPDARPALWLGLPGTTPVRIAFNDELRPHTVETIASLQAQGLKIALLSGDHEAAVQRTAAACNIADWHANMRPAAKTKWLEALEAQGHKVLMVGDGLNDSPALARAWVSLSPASGADIAQTTADIVFQRESLAAVTHLLRVAGRSRTLTRQNIIFALGYNAIAIPLAMAGFVTPLFAALAMSFSSLTVTGNAFRLTFRPSS